MTIKNLFKKVYLNKYFCQELFSKLIIVLLFLLLILNHILSKFHRKKVGIIGVSHCQNIGNSLLKYSISIILKRYGFEPYLIGIHLKPANISFLNKYTNVRITENFSDIRENDYKLLIVNSDQTWRKNSKNFYNIAFLKFAEKWNIPKFIYGASIGINKWFSKSDEKIAKYLLKDFTGISVRDLNLINLIKEHLGINAIFVLDPTLLIEKKYFLNIIKNYKNHINIKNNYIFTYKITNLKNKINIFIHEASKKLNYSIYDVSLGDKENIEKFLHGIKICKAVVTDSFHGTVFSIIFHKPFITFQMKNDGRLETLKKIFDLKNRIIESDEYPDVNLLKQPLYINKAKLNKLKINSLRYLKKNLLNPFINL